MMLTWEKLHEVLQQYSVDKPPFGSFEAEMWLRQTPELRHLYESMQPQFWVTWLVDATREPSKKERRNLPSPPDVRGYRLNPETWRRQADLCEDHRATCPDGEWLTRYINYLHDVANVIEDLQTLQPPLKA